MATKPEETKRPGGPGMWVWLVLLLLLVGVGIYAASRMMGGDGATTNGSEANMDPAKQATAEAAAARGLERMREMAAMSDSRALGFAPGDQLAQARLGEAYPVFAIPLDALRSYTPDRPSASLLQASPDSQFPVLVGDSVRSSITVSRLDGGFVATQMGGAGPMQASASARPRQPGDFILRVPALGMQFLANRSDGQLLLTAIVRDPRLQLEPGRPQPAEAVLQQLVAVARTHNGEPM